MNGHRGSDPDEEVVKGSLGCAISGLLLLGVLCSSFYVFLTLSPFLSVIVMLAVPVVAAITILQFALWIIGSVRSRRAARRP
jgi:hypothetical protein